MLVVTHRLQSSITYDEIIHNNSLSFSFAINLYKKKREITTVRQHAKETNVKIKNSS